jgi:hypothetical protein
MRKIFTSLCILFVLIACESKVNYQKPDNLLSKKQMTDLLFDMHIAAATSNVSNLKLEKNRNYMSLIYKKYGIDSAEFAINNLYYTSSIDDYEEMFEALEKRLKKLQDSIYYSLDSLWEEKKTPDYYKRMQDSILK